MLGANGAGKSTLMNLLTDNVKRDSGEILYDGKEIAKMAWINGLERKRFNEEQKRLAEQYRAAGMTEEQIEQMYQFDLVEFNSRRRFSEHTQQFSENAFEESDDDKSPLLEKYLAQLSTSLDFSFASDRYGWVEEIEKPELIKGIKALSKEDLELITL